MPNRTLLNSGLNELYCLFPTSCLLQFTPLVVLGSVSCLLGGDPPAELPVSDTLSAASQERGDTQPVRHALRHNQRASPRHSLAVSHCQRLQNSPLNRPRRSRLGPPPNQVRGRPRKNPPDSLRHNLACGPLTSPPPNQVKNRPRSCRRGRRRRGGLASASPSPPSSSSFSVLTSSRAGPDNAGLTSVVARGTLFALALAAGALHCLYGRTDGSSRRSLQNTHASEGQSELELQ